MGSKADPYYHECGRKVYVEIDSLGVAIFHASGGLANVSLCTKCYRNLGDDWANEPHRFMTPRQLKGLGIFRRFVNKSKE